MFLPKLLWPLTLIIVKSEVVVIRQLHRELDKPWEDALLCRAFVREQKPHGCYAGIAVALPKPQR